MLENFIWKNVFLPEFIKKEIVSFYENHCQNPYLKPHYKKSLKQFMIYHLCNRLHKNWFQKNLNDLSISDQAKIYLKDMNLPMSLWLILSHTNKAYKIKKLLNWGLNLNNVLIKNDIEINLLHQVIWAYHEKLISIEETKEIITILLKENISLFSDCKISHYEKNKSLIKEDNSNSLIRKKNKLVEVINSWLDKELYHFLLKSSLSQSDKSLLEYLNLKNKVQTIYLEKFSGNLRKSGNDNINKQINEIDNIIKRSHIFYNQSSSYNALCLILNLPEVTEAISSQSILKCYERFSDLKIISKKHLVNNLINRDKEVVLFNLLNYGVQLKWTVIIEKEVSVLGLKLLDNQDFIEHILSDMNFDLKTCNSQGENILHILSKNNNLNTSIKNKLEKRINLLSEKNKDYLLNQLNNDNLSPMNKAIEEKNYAMIDLLVHLGFSTVEEHNYLLFPYNSSLNYLDYQILNLQEEDDYLLSLQKKWSIEKNYYKILNKLPIKDKKSKPVKI